MCTGLEIGSSSLGHHEQIQSPEGSDSPYHHLSKATLKSIFQITCLVLYSFWKLFSFSVLPLL